MTRYSLSTLILSLVALVFTACSSENYEKFIEKFNGQIAKQSIQVEEMAESNVLSQNLDNNVATCKMDDGNTATVRYSGDFAAKDVTFEKLSEVVSEDAMTSDVTLLYTGTSTSGKTETGTLYYTKVMKAAPQPEVKISRQYFVADTTMIYSTTEDGTVRAKMSHNLNRVVEWSDGNKEITPVWENKKVVVAEVTMADNHSYGYSRTAAKDVRYTSEMKWTNKEETSKDVFAISKKEGNFVQYATYIASSDKELSKDCFVAVSLSNISVDYNEEGFEPYHAEYIFDLTTQFKGQKEENHNLPNQYNSGSEYVYEATSFGMWEISLNNISLGVHNYIFDVYRYYGE